jgi:type II secretory pathway predicted ATPase ExeA
MYQEFFKFSDRPFRVPPRVDSYVPLEPIEGPRTSLVRAVERSQGPGLLIGPTGCGKSLLCHLLADHFRETHQLVFLESSQLCTRRALLQHILFELDQPCMETSEGALRLSLRRLLRDTGDHPNGMVVIVDEADHLSIPLLEELRVLTNYVAEGRSRVQLVLAGSSRLEEQFSEPRMDCFNQRLGCRCYLRSLKRDETVRYIQAHMERVGGETSELFSPEALISLYELTDGVPRLINQLCDHALLLAAEQQCSCLEAEQMEIAWADLQQLPVPVRLESSESTPAGDVVEFGELDDSSFTALPAETGEDCTTVQFGVLDDEPGMEESRTETAETESPASLETEPAATGEPRLPGTPGEDGQDVVEEPVNWMPPAFPEAAAREGQETGSPLPADDRDMIVIRNGQYLSVHDEAEETGKPHLRLYRELFDRLRQPE